MAIASRIHRSTRRWARSLLSGVLFASIAGGATLPAIAASHDAAGPQFAIAVDPALRRQPLTGRIFLFVSRVASPEPRLQYGGQVNTVPLFGRDVDRLPAGSAVVIDATAPGYPVATLRNLPPGDYAIQALANVYTRFARSDGFTVWAHDDRGEGQQFTLSPGNLVSETQRVRIDPARSQRFSLRLDRALPAVPPVADTPFVKHLRLQSALLSKFWGAPIFLGATILLPKDYENEPARRFPAVYVQDHFSTDAPFGFDPAAKPETRAERVARASATNAESRYDFTTAWERGDTPPMVAISFAHPTPFYDDSYAVNSANNGPYGDAIMTELLPRLETEFRLMRESRARFLTGISTGGWEALALQIYHPESFNGAWAAAPDPVDFHRFQISDLYSDTSAFSTQRSAWFSAEIPAQRSTDGNIVQTMREESRLEVVLGSRGRSGEQFDAWNAAFGPVLQDGYPGELWDKTTGNINHTVVEYARDHGYDLRAYLERNWSRIGPQLVGKIHVDVGDDDDYFLNLAVYRLQTFLDATDNPAAKASFTYGRPMKPHGWQSKSTIDALREMAARLEP